MKLEKVDDKTAYENLLVKYAELESKIADLKSNFDYILGGKDLKIRELEKENAELKEKIEVLECDNYNANCNLDLITDQLTKAKDLIKNIIRITWGEGWNYSLDWKVKAEQFLQEIEKC
jgi:hypothetical protein